MMHYDYQHPVLTETEARDRWPDCAVYVECGFGWAAFDTAADHETWLAQV